LLSLRERVSITRSLAHKLDSLVRVTRREVHVYHYVTAFDVLEAD